MFTMFFVFFVFLVLLIFLFLSIGIVVAFLKSQSLVTIAASVTRAEPPTDFNLPRNWMKRHVSFSAFSSIFRRPRTTILRLYFFYYYAIFPLSRCFPRPTNRDYVFSSFSVYDSSYPPLPTTKPTRFPLDVFSTAAIYRANVSAIRIPKIFRVFSPWHVPANRKKRNKLIAVVSLYKNARFVPLDDSLSFQNRSSFAYAVVVVEFLSSPAFWPLCPPVCICPPVDVRGFRHCRDVWTRNECLVFGTSSNPPPTSPCSE